MKGRKMALKFSWKKALIFLFVLVIGFAAGIVFKSFTSDDITVEKIAKGEKLFALDFTSNDRELMLQDLKDQKKSYENIRKVEIPNTVPPAIQFNPIPRGFKFETVKKPIVLSRYESARFSGNLNDLAFMSVGELGALIRARKITSTELTKMYLARLKKYDPQLRCVITLTEDLALKQAKRADDEIAAGKYRGPLHGIPYGAKDLLAVKGYKTTWGSVPFKDQVIDENATVIKKLEEAGAVLVAKTSVGELAWGDVWFGATTKNPWNLKEGSSGSSAGSASSTSAGLVAFAIGTETWGSIVSPSTRCGTTGLRPTFGRVSRAGVMALSWTMDKIGPICRSVEDCAIVFNSIIGADGIDQVYDLPFNYNPTIDPKNIRIGYLKKEFDEKSPTKKFDMQTLEKLKSLGFNLVPIALPDLPVDDLAFILSAEAGAAFDEITRNRKVDLMVRQTRDAWPNVFRASRFIPAVEYIQANRMRYQLIQDMEKILDGVDVYISPSFGGSNLLLTNLTGHPSVVLPNGFDEKGSPVSITFMGKLFGEAKLLAVAKVYQDSTGFHLQHPSLFMK
jgi:Asp-tRNA(Asn)/Glu-tRNA(Gln) amidotransferase A subunit family amidase